MVRFTEEMIQGLHCPAGRRDKMAFDEKQGGLGVRVTASGRRTYLVQYTHLGAKRRMPIGPCGAISLADARAAARGIMGDVAKGRDPAVERKQATAQAKRALAHEALTLDGLLDQWAALQLAHRRPSYALEAVRALRRGFPHRLRLPAADLDRKEVVRGLDGLVGSGKIAMASRMASYGRACYQWGVKRGALDANPFLNLPLAPVPTRDRVLSDAELAAIWKATDGPGSFDAIVRTLMLTGQRRGEVAGMTWSELDDDRLNWTIPAARAKNGVAHVVPLSPQARAVVCALRRQGAGDLIFPGYRGSFSGFSKSKAILDAASGVAEWRLHDIRRTVATGLQRLGVRIEVTEAVLNHVAGSRAGIVGVYQRYDYADERRAALAAWGERVTALVKGNEPSRDVARPPRSGAAANQRKRTGAAAADS